MPLAAAVTGSVATARGTGSVWYERLEKPSFQPPQWVFPTAWSILYTQSAVATAVAQHHTDEEAARDIRRRLAVNMTLNAAWSWVFFGARKPGAAIPVAAALAVSTADLARVTGRAHRQSGAMLVPYSAWTAFATVLNASIWNRNRGR